MSYRLWHNTAPAIGARVIRTLHKKDRMLSNENKSCSENNRWSTVGYPESLEPPLLQSCVRISCRQPWQHWYEDARASVSLFSLHFFSSCRVTCTPCTYGAGRGDRFSVIRERLKRGAFDHDLCRAEVVSSHPLSSRIDRQGLAAVVSATCSSDIWLIFFTFVYIYISFLF